MEVKQRRAWMCALIVTGVLLPFASAFSSVPLTVWKADPAYLSLLGPAQTVLNYSIRPPAGYELITQEIDNGAARVYLWKGPTHPNGISSVISIMILTVPPKIKKDVNSSHLAGLGAMLHGNIKILQQTHKNLNVADIQYGKVNGRPYARVAWNGIEMTHNGAQIADYGFDYGTMDGSRFITLRGEAAAPNQKEDLEFAEASAMTFRIKGASSH